ncbi:MAG: CCA tRNA nucleotidyltransferase [Bacteroidetes bacterium]|nr:CCA tRNA nucleotidyltransferase [Bacteroidota bacterium]
MSTTITLNDAVLKKIGNIADASNVRAYVVGGYVRDLLRGFEVKEIDIVVVGNGIEFAQRVARELGCNAPVVYENFGTALLLLPERKLEFVGARKESYTRNSRKPRVSVGTLDEDLSRRDFTVNAIAVSLNADTYGEVIDPYNGIKDIESRRLTTPLNPEATFDDDPLRILRAMRFAAQLQFSIDERVLQAARTMADRLRIVSQERITEELLKILATQKPSVGFFLMYETGVLSVIFPELAALGGVEQREDYHHKDVFKHTLQVVDNVALVSENLWLRFAALVHDIAKPKTKAFKPGIGWTFHGHEELGARMIRPLFQKLRLPLDKVPYIEKLVRLHLRPQALVDDGVTDSAIRRLMFEAGNDIDDLITLCRADITSKNPKLIQQVLQNYERVLQRMAEVEEKDRIRNWQPPLRGDEIMTLCNLQPGPMVGYIKDAITDAILDGVIPNDHDAAVQYLLSKKDELLQQTPVKKKQRNAQA